MMDEKFLDEKFCENNEPNKAVFDKIATSNELHYIAENYNWDNGITVLEWIAESELCSEATALMIFWRGQPYDYVKYNYYAKSIKHMDMDVFNLIKNVMEKYKNGFYKKTSIKYNPKEDMPNDENIPEIMFKETYGEEPYIYYRKEEIFSWFGEYLENLLARCDSSMELYNIAYLMDIMTFSRNWEKLIEHKYCDKGIALLIYWKLKKYCMANVREIENRIKNNEYKEIIKYNPIDDKENKYFKKNKWEILEVMKKEII
jgi:hypothetical protein